MINGYDALYRRSLKKNIKNSHSVLLLVLEYIENHVLPIMQRYDPNNPLPRSVLIMDNAPVHMKEAIEALLEPTGCRIIYTAKYAPFLHPIERMFNQYKSCLKRLDRQMDDLYEKHVLC